MQKSLLYIVLLGAVLAVLGSCKHTADTAEEPVVAPGMSTSEAVSALLAADSVTPWLPATLEMPDGTHNLLYNPVGGRYADVFNDSNYVHWAEAEVVGIDIITDTRSHWVLKERLEKVVPCQDFYVDELNYSSPYLVPRAARLLHEIGARFHQTVKERGGGDYRIKVTSVLRTPESVCRLRRVNRNSVDSSVHMMATTFDISYARFICDNPSVAHNAEDLKGVLAEVLMKMRDEGKCYVKYEMKQPCFHITCRDYKP